MSQQVQDNNYKIDKRNYKIDKKMLINKRNKMIIKMTNS